MELRLTAPALRALKFLMEKPREGRSGAEISKAARVGSGTLYPLLARFENAGWLESEWEEIDPSVVGRPRRRLYKVTGHGQMKAREALSEVYWPRGEAAWQS
jgi:PadR family transcriptional regulator PadR